MGSDTTVSLNTSTCVVYSILNTFVVVKCPAPCWSAMSNPSLIGKESEQGQRRKVLKIDFTLAFSGTISME